MPRPRRPAALCGRVFRARDVLDAGLLTPSALRTSAWRRLHRGIHADADLPDDHDLRISGALPPRTPGRRLQRPDGGVAVRRTRARRRRCTGRGVGARGRAVRAGRRTARPTGRPALLRRVRRRAPALHEPGADGAGPGSRGVAGGGGGRARRPPGSGRRRPARAGPGSGHPGLTTGLRRARQAVALADRRAESPQETRVRASSPWRNWSPSRSTRSATTRVASSPGWTSPPRAPPRRRVRRSLARAGRPAGPGPAPAQPPDRHGLAGPVRDGRRPAGPGRAGGPGRCGARPLTGQAPKSWVHHGPPGPSATPTPSVDSEQFRMFARCPGLSIHPAMTAAASRWP